MRFVGLPCQLVAHSSSSMAPPMAFKRPQISTIRKAEGRELQKPQGVPGDPRVLHGSPPWAPRRGWLLQDITGVPRDPFTTPPVRHAHLFPHPTFTSALLPPSPFLHLGAPLSLTLPSPPPTSPLPSSTPTTTTVQSTHTSTRPTPTSHLNPTSPHPNAQSLSHDRSRGDSGGGRQMRTSGVAGFLGTRPREAEEAQQEDSQASSEWDVG